MKKVEIILDENIGINVEEDLTISDVIKSMAMLGAVIKDTAKSDKNVKYDDIMKIVDQLSDEIIQAPEEVKTTDKKEKTKSES